MNLNFKYTQRLVNSLLKIEKYKTSIDFLYLPTRAKQKLIYEAKLKKTHFSTSIEGNALSINQVEKVIKNKDDSYRINAEQEVQNYWDALTFLEESKFQNKEIDIEFISCLHDIIQRSNQKITRIGYREPTPPGVLFAVYDSSTKQPEYIPPESKDIPYLMQELVEWYQANKEMPSPIKAAIMHYALTSIHPYDDGNGRTSRALATYVLMLDDYDLKGFNSFEEYYMSDLDGYYSSLQMGLPALFYNGRENPPHLEVWIEYFCRIMELNAETIYDQAWEASQKGASKLTSNLTKKDLTLIRYCLENNISAIKNKELAEVFGVTPRAISKWAKEWMGKGILVASSGTQRITEYKLATKYATIKISELGFIDI